MILAAARLAAEAHRGQRRRYTDRPYIEHPARVAARLSWHDAGDEYLVSAAWLHDVLEDCQQMTLADINRVCCNYVGQLVRELTNPSKQHPELDRAARKAMDREHLAHVSREARLIKLADRVDNLRELTGAPVRFIETYTAESELLLQALAGTDDQLEWELAAEIRHLRVTTNESGRKAG